jgi:hypothetical protein
MPSAAAAISSVVNRARIQLAPSLFAQALIALDKYVVREAV